MTQLNQLIGVEAGTRVRVDEAVRAAVGAAAVPDLITGNVGAYRPLDVEHGEHLPAERKDVRVRVDEVVGEVGVQLARLFDLAASKEMTNTRAFADVIVDGTPLLEDVPVTYLLFLDRELEALRKLVADLPVLDLATSWEQDGDGAWRTPEVESIRTKKLPRNHVKAEATKEHPAQVEVWSEDVLVGYWTRRRMSGALHPRRRKIILDRIERLQRAVKFAKEQANQTEVEDRNFGQVIMAHLLA